MDADRPENETPSDPSRIQRLAETFATEYLTGHFRPLRNEDEQKKHQQLVVVMLAFASQCERLAGKATRPALTHPTRTIIVATRLSAQVLHTTYLNALDDDEPSVVTVVLSEPPHAPVAGGVPDVGETKVTVNR